MIKAGEIAVYETLSEILDPGHSCLIVWDVQNGLVDRIFNKEEFIANLKGLVENLRNKMPVELSRCAAVRFARRPFIHRQ